MTLEKLYCIYKHTSPSGKSYIGQSKDIIKREKQHQKTYKCPAFRNAINKYGWDNFIHEILEDNLTIDEANIFEELYINEYNTLSPNGYNLHTGGLNYKASEETKEKIRQSRLGTTLSEETKEKLRGYHNNYGKRLTDETKEKLRIANSGENNPNWGKKGELSPHWGKKLSVETIQKRSESNYKNYIITFPDEHEELIKGLRVFCDKYNLRYSGMSDLARGVHKQHKGFKCRHATAEDEALYLPPIE